MSQKYPFIIAYVVFFVLNLVVDFILGIIGAYILPNAYAPILTAITTIVVSFFIFRFVIRRNVLPYVSQDISIGKAETEDSS